MPKNSNIEPIMVLPIFFGMGLTILAVSYFYGSLIIGGLIFGPLMLLGFGIRATVNNKRSTATTVVGVSAAIAAIALLIVAAALVIIVKIALVFQ